MMMLRGCVFWTSTTGLAPLTVTVSSSAPTLSSALTVAVKFGRQLEPSRRTVVKPVRLNVTA